MLKRYLSQEFNHRVVGRTDKLQNPSLPFCAALLRSLPHATSWPVSNLACTSFAFLRKEVIQPQLPLLLPCYDFVPVISPAFGGSLLAVSFPTSGVTNSHDVTGGVYKARERIHRAVLIHGY